MITLVLLIVSLPFILSHFDWFLLHSLIYWCFLGFFPKYHSQNFISTALEELTYSFGIHYHLSSWVDFYHLHHWLTDYVPHGISQASSAIHRSHMKFMSPCPSPDPLLQVYHPSVKEIQAQDRNLGVFFQSLLSVTIRTHSIKCYRFSHSIL